MQFVDMADRILSKPDDYPENVYKVMLQCWEYAPEDRANFKEVFNSLAELYGFMNT